MHRYYYQYQVGRVEDCEMLRNIGIAMHQEALLRSFVTKYLNSCMCLTTLLVLPHGGPSGIGIESQANARLSRHHYH